MFSKGLLCDQHCAGYWGCSYKQDKRDLQPLWSLCFSCDDRRGLVFKKTPNCLTERRNRCTVVQTIIATKKTNKGWVLEWGSTCTLGLEGFSKDVTSKLRSKWRKGASYTRCAGLSAYQAACAETLKQVCALVIRDLEEDWCGWIEGQWGVGRGMLWHKIGWKMRLSRFGCYEDCSGC